MAGRQVHQGYIPGVIGRVAQLHGRYYGQRFGFGAFFEARVAADCADFFRRYDPDRDTFLAQIEGDDIVGSVAVVGPRDDSGVAQLRWFIVDETLQGRGVGRLLLRSAIGFCRQRGYAGIFLDTFDGLDVARHLYEQEGFQLVSEQSGSQWGQPVLEQRFVIALRPPVHSSADEDPGEGRER